MRMRPIVGPVPDTGIRPAGGMDEIAGQLAAGGVAVLTGAGISTESGIPDYRGVTGRHRRHSPMTYQDFVSDEENRRRYWARGYVGRRAVAKARPNAGHQAVQALRAAGYVDAVITQNVDGLHQAAGTTDAVALHGSLDRVVCLDCETIGPRDELDARLLAANGEFLAAQDAAGLRVNPDGDIELPDDIVRTFRVVPCARCGGVLKPYVVFFGENVPKPRTQRCFDLIDAADSLLVLGSSLAVLSGLRFVRRAAKDGKPVSIINLGPTRGDALAHAHVALPLGQALTELTERLDIA
ncbi:MULTISPECIES: NAD-dependent protein deacetylase [Streptomyces]|uniref:NAD-dependent protein deacetylase n=1 Tax=Streptomyces TaxID=1883 RepID=UPI000A3CF311|nr:MULTISPECIES: NAD-dependent protein deacetylase [Streptomyces]MYQ99096.1 NAD-dependent protein deacetylase [Streptomyces sp. SID6139]MYR20763.1 NAD-dependent protein deacetylase [Streptomyces sp. SID6137]